MTARNETINTDTNPSTSAPGNNEGGSVISDAARTQDDVMTATLTDMKNMLSALTKKAEAQDKANDSVAERLEALASENRRRAEIIGGLGTTTNQLGRTQRLGLTPTSLNFSTPMAPSNHVSAAEGLRSYALPKEQTPTMTRSNPSDPTPSAGPRRNRRVQQEDAEPRRSDGSAAAGENGADVNLPPSTAEAVNESHRHRTYGPEDKSEPDTRQLAEEEENLLWVEHMAYEDELRKARYETRRAEAKVPSQA